MTSRFDLLIFEDAQQMKDRRAKETKSREKKLAKVEKIGYCEGFLGKCDNKDDVKWTPARTCYPWHIDKKPLEDPNRDIFLCDSCEIEYHEHWDEMWNDYRAGLL